MKLKRLFLDIETSPNEGRFWAAGAKKYIPYQNIIKERAVICAAYKWEGQKTVHAVRWDAGDDRELLVELAEVIAEADEIVGHNSDNFDLKWLRTRMAFHGIRMTPLTKGVDTLKMAKARFYFNSNRLDYIAKYLGVGAKIRTEPNLWDEVLDGDELALDTMVKYCKGDVVITEKVYHKLIEYCPPYTHAAVVSGGEKYHCPQCASEKTQRRGFRTTAQGDKKQIMSCTDCGRNFTIAQASSNKLLKEEKRRAA